ncbi:MAG: septum formation initiator family protein [Chloroflexi bacterium]|nr:septum formation initiator family protein [Chloroflexota bacterium]
MHFRLPNFGPTYMVLTLAILLLGLFAYAFLQTAAQSYRLREMERELFVEVQDLRVQRAELEGLAAYIESDEYIEAFARQQFGLVRPGEILVQVDAPPSEVDPRRPGERWWEALFDTAAGGMPDVLPAVPDSEPGSDSD